MVMAALLMGIFLAYINAQHEYVAGKEAQSLADHLSRTAFSAAIGEETLYELPSSVGSSSYELDSKNNNFIVRITGGAQKGNEYRSSVGIKLEVRSLPGPNETLYAQGRADKVIISSTKIEPPVQEKISPENFVSPQFYRFSKTNPKAATAILASYFFAEENYPNRENLDIKSYEWQSNDTLNARITEDDNFLTTVQVFLHENEENVGFIDQSWIVYRLEKIENNLDLENSCPSVKKAHSGGWIYSPREIKNRFLDRTWRMPENGTIVNLSGDPNPLAASATTNISTYPTWRFEVSFKGDKYVLHFAAMAWNPLENQPGFAFESEPDLEAVV